MTMAAAMGPLPMVAVIVPCRGHAVELVDCLDSVCNQELAGTYEVIVVDSATDGRVAEVASRFSQVRVVRSPKPLLPGPARNLGVQATQAPLLAFIDADCIAEPGWLVAARKALLAGVDGVGGPVGDIHPHDPIAVADNMLQFYELARGRPAGPAAYLPSCNLAMRRIAFETLGGFRDVFAGEDILLTQEIAAQGPHKLRFDPEMRVRHCGRRRLMALWRHHRTFGRARGEFGLRTRPFEVRLVRSRAYFPPLVVKRLAYMTMQITRWSPWRLAQFLLLSPLVTFGAIAWAIGVVESSRSPRRQFGASRTVDAEPTGSPSRSEPDHDATKHAARLHCGRPAREVQL